MYRADIRIDTATPFMLQKVKQIRQERVNKQIGLAGRLALVEFFTKKNAEMKSATSTHQGNPKLGHSRPGLFEKFARATSYTATPSSVTLSVTHPAIRQRVKGGVIKPVRRKYLTIPARAAAYGKSAREAPVELEFAMVKDPRRDVMRPALVASGRKSAKRKTSPGLLKSLQKLFKGKQRKRAEPKLTVAQAGVWYWLAKKVTQKADPSAMIGKDALLGEIRKNLTGYIQGGASNG